MHRENEVWDGINTKMKFVIINILQIGKRQILSDGQEFTLGDEKRLQPVAGRASRRAKKKQCVVLNEICFN